MFYSGNTTLFSVPIFGADDKSVGEALCRFGDLATLEQELEI